MWALIWRCAGVVGVNPGPLTLRELLAMVEARTQDEWARLSSLMALLANCNRDPKRSKPYQPHDFDPFGRRPEPKPADRAELRAWFLGGHVAGVPAPAQEKRQCGTEN